MKKKAKKIIIDENTPLVTMDELAKVTRAIMRGKPLPKLDPLNEEDYEVVEDEEKDDEK